MMSVFTRQEKMSTLILGVGSVTSSLLQLALITFLARGLGSENYGIFLQAQAVALTITSLLSLGLEAVVLRELVEKNESQENVLSTALIIRQITSLVAFFFIWLVTSLLYPDQPSIKFVALLLSVGGFFQAIEIYAWWFRSKVDSKPIVISKLLGQLSGLALLVFVILLEGNILWFSLSFVLEMCVTGVALIIFFKQKNSVYHNLFSGSVNVAKSFVKSGMVLAAISFFTSLYLRIDRLIIGNWLSNEAVGVYGTATQLADATIFIPLALISSVFPGLLKYKNTQLEKYEGNAQKVIMIITYLGIAISVGATLLGPFAISLVFGSRYAESAGVLQIYIWSMIFVYQRMFIDILLVAERLIVWSLIQAMVATVLNILLNILLIPTFGLPGAAVSSLISYGTAFYLLNLCNPRTRKFFRWQTNAFLLRKSGSSL